jgi:hypothetical protein
LGIKNIRGISQKKITVKTEGIEQKDTMVEKNEVWRHSKKHIYVKK